MLDSRIPEFSDKELENLQGNAVRLSQSGTDKQKAEAERLLPIIAAEMETRGKAKAIATREKLAAAKESRAAKRTKIKAAKAAEAEA